MKFTSALCSGGKKINFFHITTPIFYPNAKPHLGHLYTGLLSDVRGRWSKLNQVNTKFITGTDEHGLKIQNAALKAHVTPQKFVDNLCLEFKKLDSKGWIDYTRFIRTTDTDHIQNVIELWKKCFAKGFIYKGQHKGWYSISDETFYPESQVVEVLPNGKEIPLNKSEVFDQDNITNRSFINTESRNKVVYQSEINYFFKLSEFKCKLIDYIRFENPDFIKPEMRKEQILKELESSKELQDLSISRPAARLTWAIEVPNDPSQKIYVWFDALCNYITSIGSVQSLTKNEGDPINIKWWENTTHVIGKDIIKFHAIYWPAFLMAAGLPLPKQIYVHGHWLSNGVKMSKSLGNVVDPIAMIDYYGVDPVRWYILENSCLEADGDFIESQLWQTRELLVSKWGNLITRCCSPKFDLKRAVGKFSGNTDNNSSIFLELCSRYLEKDLAPTYTKLLNDLEVLPALMDNYITNFNMQQALKLLWSILNDTNTFIQTTEPWKCKDNQDKQDLIIYLAVEVSRILSILSQPVIPQLSAQFLDRIKVSPERRGLEYAALGKDDNYGVACNKKGAMPITRIPIREKHL
ncbi:related to Methionine--tRNA ligase, mitochondrial [Saccharomycodes ludwigii]|uniref:Methionine--tRNA ligase, mitochondrial n=1 Tax=Saccharomycodes ludwigii TaxID=36035 RepID=A0A376B9J6_9ASCO|nr:hypothetical protein SCDLUD_004527 [Saccharomycodes ludwigii]KAH3899102.1 hypothetical protein SCDLUD_004527 [Saccharomycodes ludwigii]SSD61322.1 related to Methionine--tRNA ligase, mitochondrial [Saccharomycodes ludwigii]